MHDGIIEPYDTEVIKVDYKKVRRYSNYLIVLSENYSRVITLYPDDYQDEAGFHYKKTGYYLRTLRIKRLGQYANVKRYYFLQEEVPNYYA